MKNFINPVYQDLIEFLLMKKLSFERYLLTLTSTFTKRLSWRLIMKAAPILCQRSAPLSTETLERWLAEFIQECFCTFYYCNLQTWCDHLILFLQDGRNYTTKSRFPCFYTKKFDDLVAVFLDLEVSTHFPSFWLMMLLKVSHSYFMFMLLVPLGIFLFSCFFCIACSFIIIVDDQGKWIRFYASVDILLLLRKVQ